MSEMDTDEVDSWKTQSSKSRARGGVVEPKLFVSAPVPTTARKIEHNFFLNHTYFRKFIDL